MAEQKHGIQRAKSSHLDWQPGDKKRTLGMASVFGNLKGFPQGHTFSNKKTSPNLSQNILPTVEQLYKHVPIEPYSFKPPQNCLNF